MSHEGDKSAEKQILIVEDHADLARLLQLHVRDLNAAATIASDGGMAVDLFKKRQFDLVILDLMLPIMDGIGVCREIRKLSETVPIIMLTSRDAEIDRVLGLEMGADDYVTKPFSIPELMARIKARFRSQRAQHNHPEHEAYIFRDLQVDIPKRQVLVRNRHVDLTAREFDLLVYFMQSPGRVFNRIQLLNAVWGYHYDGYEHTVNTHINRLRNKIERDPSRPEYIHTVWGVGYRFYAEGEDDLA